jgi:hypothetical protein
LPARGASPAASASCGWLLLLTLDRVLDGSLLAARYALEGFAADPAGRMAEVATLRFIPLFFDILPLYILLLAMIPLMVPLAARSPMLALGLSASLWLLAQLSGWNLPAEPGGLRAWYFNPLAWQFLFFIGFGVTSRWFAVPAATRALIALAAGFLALSTLVVFWPFHTLLPWTHDIYVAVYPEGAITMLHPLRLLHIVVLGWLFAALLAPVRDGLQDGPLQPVVRIGQQALVTFLTGIFLSALGGVVIAQAGGATAAVIAVNLAGFAALVAAAAIARNVKGRISAARTSKGTEPWPVSQ